MLGPDTMTCTATLAGQPLTGTGKDGCTFTPSAGSTGEPLVVTAHVTLFGAERTIEFPFTVG